MCDRCNSSGILSHYSHVNSGVCFKCGGTGGTDINLAAIKTSRIKLQRISDNALKHHLTRNGKDISGWSRYSYYVIADNLEFLSSGGSMIMSINAVDLLTEQEINFITTTVIVYCDKINASFELIDGRIKINWK